MADENNETFVIRYSLFVCCVRVNIFSCFAAEIGKESKIAIDRSIPYLRNDARDRWHVGDFEVITGPVLAKWI